MNNKISSKVKEWTGTKSIPLNCKSHHIRISCKKSLTVKQGGYVHNKWKNEGIISSEQVYEYECNDDQQTVLKLNTYECVMLNHFELYNVHAESAEIEKWSIFSKN